MKRTHVKRPAQQSTKNRQGFSLLELMVAVAILSLLMGYVLNQISLVQQRSRTEQVKVDIFQEAREFSDQIVRDLHQAGYPNIRMFDTSGWSPAVVSPSYNDSRLAAGITKIAPGEVKFEGDVDGDGNVHVVDYVLTSTGNNCPCLQRSDVLKSGTAVLSNDVQNVENAGTSADPIFIAYTASGTSVTSADTTTGAGLISLATIKTVQFVLKVKAPIVDPRTGQAPETTLSGQVTIRNCSLAASGQSNSC
jgi:prepilin-type N-terminal cleavage/methylation domain-containing protein